MIGPTAANVCFSLYFAPSGVAQMMGLLSLSSTIKMSLTGMSPPNPGNSKLTVQICLAANGGENSCVKNKSTFERHTAARNGSSADVMVFFFDSSVRCFVSVQCKFVTPMDQGAIENLKRPENSSPVIPFIDGRSRYEFLGDTSKL
ncbi:hypothetical protein M514_17295 [Trichuris suis]|uniref:Uncharacterized protein n=1 Tax=Trichuris suis TaxID=68888 RepID=A0A085NM06_9BILA|nr:hypothetical protein M514_17295 [Trichuris suis]